MSKRGNVHLKPDVKKYDLKDLAIVPLPAVVQPETIEGDVKMENTTVVEVANAAVEVVEAEAQKFNGLVQFSDDRPDIDSLPEEKKEYFYSLLTKEKDLTTQEKHDKRHACFYRTIKEIKDLSKDKVMALMFYFYSSPWVI